MPAVQEITAEYAFYNLDDGTYLKVSVEEGAQDHSACFKLHVWNAGFGESALPDRSERHQQAESMLLALEAIGEVPDEVRVFVTNRSGEGPRIPGNYHGDQLIDATRSYISAIRQLSQNNLSNGHSNQETSAPCWVSVPHELKQFMSELFGMWRSFAAKGERFDAQFNDEFGYALPADDTGDIWEIHFGKDKRVKIGWAWHLELTLSEIACIAEGSTDRLILIPCQREGCVRMIRRTSFFCQVHESGFLE